MPQDYLVGILAFGPGYLFNVYILFCYKVDLVVIFYI